MDAFKLEEIARYRSQPSGERLLESLAVMADGIAMKRANLRRQHPELEEDAIDTKLDAWLRRA